MKNYWVIDCETSGLPEAVQREIAPDFEAGKNLRDPDKIAAAIAEKKQAWLDGAALDATRCQILAIGLAGADLTDPKLLHAGTEHGMLTHLRELATVYHDLTLVGHNILGFDIPLLCRRMWKHGISPPARWIDCSTWRATWAYDTMVAWSCGNRDQRISLDVLAWHLGCGRKNGSGADFAKLYQTDREKALEYLRNDLMLTEQVYLTMTKRLRPAGAALAVGE
jgi:3'-5' exonuclease